MATLPDIDSIDQLRVTGNGPEKTYHKDKFAESVYLMYTSLVQYPPQKGLTLNG